MNRTKAAIDFYLLMAIASSGIFFSSCSEEIRDGSVIFTQIVDNTKNIDNLAIASWRYNVQSRIAAIDPDDPDRTLKILTSDLYSALSPRISYDGKFLLFSGKQNENDPWQIWEMNLKNSKIRKITSVDGNCIDPVYLPGGRIVFGKLVTVDTIKSGLSLYTCNLDGSKLQKITFDSYNYSTSTVLKDGRVLAITKHTDPSGYKELLMVLRPDGTKNELFYDCKEGNTLNRSTCETNDGKIVLIESEKENRREGKLISINYNRPLHSSINYSSEINGSFQSVSAMNSGKLLVSYCPSGGKNYSLYEFDPLKKVLGKSVYSSEEFDAVEAVVVENHDRPKKLPSEVDPGVKTGLLLCQDINFTGRLSDIKSASVTRCDKIEIIGADSSLGIVQAEKDGSFYLKVIADTPFRIRSLDENGNIINETCDWIYLRPNERRDCIGCHEDPEMVPENRVPLAVKMAPNIIPVHKSKLKEKAIELE